MTPRKILIAVFTIASISMVLRGGDSYRSSAGPAPIGPFVGGGLGMIAVALLMNGRDRE